MPSAGQLQSPVPEPWRLAYGWAHDPGRANQILSHHEPEDNTAGLLAAVLLQCGQSLRENEANLEEWGAERGRPVERGCSGPLKDSPPLRTSQSWKRMHPCEGFRHCSQALC